MTEQQIKWLIANFRTTGNGEIAKHLGVSVDQARYLMEKYRLKRTKEEQSALKLRQQKEFIAEQKKAILAGKPAKSIGGRTRRLLSEEQRQWLEANYRTMSDADLAKHLGISAISVQGQLTYLGLIRRESEKQALKAQAMRRIRQAKEATRDKLRQEIELSREQRGAALSSETRRARAIEMPRLKASDFNGIGTIMLWYTAEEMERYLQAVSGTRAGRKI